MMKTTAAVLASALLMSVTAAHADPGPAPGATPAPVAAPTPAAASTVDDTVTVGDRSGFDEHGNLHEHWVPFTGSGQLLDSEDFYRRVGRPDLAAAKEQRRMLGTGLLLTGIAVVGGSLIYGISQASGGASSPSCSANQSFQQFSNCVQAGQAADTAQMQRMQDAAPWVIGGALVGGVAALVGGYYLGHQDPISEAEAQQLAVAHNAGVSSVRVTPYAGPTGGGLALGGSF